MIIARALMLHQILGHFHPKWEEGTIYILQTDITSNLATLPPNMRGWKNYVSTTKGITSHFGTLPLNMEGRKYLCTTS